MSDVTTSKTSYPRISAGKFSAILVEQMLISLLGEEAAGDDIVSHLNFVRSKDALVSLRDKEIDLAIMHRSSLADDELSGLTVASLLEWTAVLIQPTGQPVHQLSTITWKKDSFGDKLLTQFQKSNPHLFQHSTKPPTAGESFISAVERIRRNLPYQLVIPDIYLTKRDKKTLAQLDENKDKPDTDKKTFAQPRQVPVKGELVAVFRSGEQDRLEKYINKDAWKKLYHLSWY